MRTTILAALLVLMSGALAQAEMFTLGDLHIDSPWARASIGKAPNGAAYMTITTKGAETDRLIAIESDVAKHVALHTHLMDGGIMKMRPVEAIEVAPGEPTLLKPGGLHVMLMGLKAPLVKGESFALTLVFERAGKVEVTVMVEDASTMQAPTGMKHDHSS